MAAAPRKLLSAACRASAGRGAPNLRTSLAANTRLPTITSSSFHSARRLQAVKPFILADVGEGTRECQIIQWFVQPGARVRQFDKICEVQSDKAATEITSRYDGVIKKLHYEVDDTAEVGKPLVDIDVDGDPADEAPPTPSPPPVAAQVPSPPKTEPIHEHTRMVFSSNQIEATPAVRHLSKSLGIDLANVHGTGRGGRISKEDLHAYAASRDAAAAPSAPAAPTSSEDRTIRLDGFRGRMFKTMTESLSIPHFMFSDPVDFTALTAARRQSNAAHPAAHKLSSLPFVVKAVSAALKHYPALNAHLTVGAAGEPVLVHRAGHNIGVAIDTAHGLVVPVVRDVQARTVREVGAEIARLAALARANKLAPADVQGATFTVSNIGSIAGSVVAPVIVAPQVAILGVGRARVVPGFDAEGELVRREEAIFSWSADHRVVDGATVARAAEKVKAYLEGLGDMLADMK